MKINNALLQATKILKSKQIDSPRLDAEILLAFTLKKPREFLLTYPEKKLTLLEISKYQNLVRRRAHREPLAYITGKKEFCGLEFYVDKNVLIPRPETETLVNETLKYVCTIIHDRELLYNRKTVIIDVGTGSGCVAMKIAWSLKPGAYHLSGNDSGRQNIKQRQCRILAIDSSHQALRVAKKNAKLHSVEKHITFLRGNLLEPFISQFYRSIELENLIVVANLPYLTPQGWKKTQPEIKKYEPPSALVGGKDGFRYYRELLQQIKQVIPRLNHSLMNKGRKKDGVISVTCFFEINPQQKGPLKKLISTLFPDAKIKFVKDLNGANRVAKLEINELTG